MVKVLAEHGASVDAIGRDGWTPLCLAARQGSSDVAKALLDAHANVFAPSANGKTALDIATINRKHSKSAVLELLMHETVARVLDIAYSRTPAKPSCQPGAGSDQGAEGAESAVECA